MQVLMMQKYPWRTDPMNRSVALGILMALSLPGMASAA